MKFDDLGICLLVDFSEFCVFCCFDFVSVCLDLGLVGLWFRSLAWVEFGGLLVSAGVCRLVGAYQNFLELWFFLGFLCELWIF